jgi:hypothetical protein
VIANLPIQQELFGKPTLDWACRSCTAKRSISGYANSSAAPTIGVVTN